MTDVSLEPKFDNNCLNSVQSTIKESGANNRFNSGRHGLFGNTTSMGDILVDESRKLHAISNFRKVCIIRDAVMTDA